MIRDPHWHENWQAEARDRVLDEGETVAHALFCPVCDVQGEARSVLALVGWTEAAFLEALEARRA